MARARPWGAGDKTGGSLDDILAAVRARYPQVQVTRLVGTHSADDENVYWVKLAQTEVQIDTAGRGSAPFVVEGLMAGSRLDTDDQVAALRHLESLLDPGR